MALDLYIQIYCLVWFFPPHLPPESRGSTRSYYIGCATSVVCYCFNKEMKWLLPKISVCSLFPLPSLAPLFRSSSAEFTFVAFLSCHPLWNDSLRFEAIVLFISERGGQSMSLKNLAVFGSSIGPSPPLKMFWSLRCRLFLFSIYFKQKAALENLGRSCQKRGITVEICGYFSLIWGKVQTWKNLGNEKSRRSRCTGPFIPFLFLHAGPILL